jgi:hypothetical protein
MNVCPSCRREWPEIYRYCTHCGSQMDGASRAIARPSVAPESLNHHALYGMVALLVLAILFPPWETPPAQPPQFLGLHFILSPPTPDAVVSRVVITIELVTIAIAGLYGAFLFRSGR